MCWLWCQQGSPHHTFIELPNHPMTRKVTWRGADSSLMTVNSIFSHGCGSDPAVWPHWVKERLILICSVHKKLVYVHWLGSFEWKIQSLAQLPTILCSTDSNPLLCCCSGAATDLNLLRLGLWATLMHFMRLFCSCFCFVAGFCASGGFAGNGHSVGSGQQTAGALQDAGRNGWASFGNDFKARITSKIIIAATCVLDNSTIYVDK